MSTSDPSRAAKRALRQQIGQLRRQLDRRLETARRDTRRLMSLEEWLRNRPWAAVLTALGLGAAAAKGLRGPGDAPRDAFSPKQLGQLAATVWQWVGRWRESWASVVAAVRESMASAPEVEATASAPALSADETAASDFAATAESAPGPGGDAARGDAAKGVSARDVSARDVSARDVSARGEGDRHVAD